MENHQQGEKSHLLGYWKNISKKYSNGLKLGFR